MGATAAAAAAATAATTTTTTTASTTSTITTTTYYVRRTTTSVYLFYQYYCGCILSLQKFPAHLLLFPCTTEFVSSPASAWRQLLQHYNLAHNLKLNSPPKCINGHKDFLQGYPCFNGLFDVTL